MSATFLGLDPDPNADPNPDPNPNPDPKNLPTWNSNVV